MYDKLLNLEKCFFDMKFISDRRWLEGIIHDDFIECGKSGRLYNKKETVEALLGCDGNRDIVIYNFECIAANDGCWTVHYITIDDNAKYYRTSLWIKDRDNDIRLFFHQASALTAKIELSVC